MPKGKLIHCNGIVDCIEPDERGYMEENSIDAESFRNIFFKDYGLGYILDLSLQKGIHFHIATHTIKTSTCKEKAKITGLPLERVIKGFYLQDRKTEKMYGLAIPGDSNYSLSKLSKYLKIELDDAERRIGKVDEKDLPMGIEYGTVHPFANERAFKDGKLETIFFDINHLEKRKKEGELDDFSFTTHPSTGYDNHRLSIQINYADAYEILKTAFPEKIKAIELI